MENIAYLIRKTGMSFNEILDLPYAVFLSLLMHFRIFDIQSTPEGRNMLEKSKRLYETEPDLDRIRGLKSYQSQK